MRNEIELIRRNTKNNEESIEQIRIKFQIDQEELIAAQTELNALVIKPKFIK